MKGSNYFPWKILKILIFYPNCSKSASNVTKDLLEIRTPERSYTKDVLNLLLLYMLTEYVQTIILLKNAYTNSHPFRR